MTSIRQFRPTDLLRAGLTNLDPLTENYDLKFYSQYMLRWPSFFTVAEDVNGRIIGYMMGKVEEDPAYRKFDENYLPWHGHVTALTVAPQCRRLGLAKALTEQLERDCEDQNAWFVDLFVREGNAAVTLYKNMGYKVYRRVVEYYSDDPTGRKSVEDAFDMRKPLKRDKNLRYAREDGENYRINPEDLFHG